MAEKKIYGVVIIEHSQAPADDASWTVNGFPTFELAREYARRFVRDSVEELRGPSVSREAILQNWLMWGENALVTGSEGMEGYNARDEIDFFLDHPATDEERNFKAIREKAGIRF